MGGCVQRDFYFQLAVGLPGGWIIRQFRKMAGAVRRQMKCRGMTVNPELRLLAQIDRFLCQQVISRLKQRIRQRGFAGAAGSADEQAPAVFLTMADACTAVRSRAVARNNAMHSNTFR